jgi:hypothetical protein
MLQAYEMYDLKINNKLVYPETLWRITDHCEHMKMVCIYKMYLNLLISLPTFSWG